MTNTYHKSAFTSCKDSKKLVVFIHGFMGSPRQFDSLAEVVVKNGFNALVLLLPGHGGTLKEFSSVTSRDWRNYVKAEVSRLAEDFDDIWLVGHSMGGLLALNTSVYPNPKVRGAFVIACPLELNFLSKEDIRVRLISIFGDDDNQIKKEYKSKSSVPRHPLIIFRSLAPMFEVTKLMRFVTADLDKIRTPVMAVYSIKDELISINSLGILKSKLEKAPFEYAVLTDSLHAFYTDEEWKIISGNLVGFIENRKEFAGS